ncbi:PQQ-dependent sugar dehydrogenase [Nocardioides sp. R-C-SC26]|uniref:PQQ-dependent sugar dehydrogenase n=1 Tax=Nocardioides sp. R-C-SC26 TaxID=2870414 RepID=UPI001E3A55C2|nr:PQQ-dependent sugar dehydrogenase [Nocardioides sp. R-C-SC26]
MRLLAATSFAATITLVGAGLSAATAGSGPGVAADSSLRVAPGTSAERAAPALSVRRQAGGLNHPWDVREIGNGRLLVTERDPARLSVISGSRRSTVEFPSDRVWVSGETGLMGLELDAAFPRNGRFYTCSGWQDATAPGGHDVRVNAWRLNGPATKASLIGPLLTGLPTTSGRHGGCRLLLAENGALIVGTGDAAVGSNPRNLRSLGGKTLRLDPRTGRPWKSNPFIEAANRAQRYVLTYGHRNIQGLAQRGDGTLWSVEHGSYRDDEVNRLVAGGDYGWNPVPGYNESVPMTDQRLPGRQIGARWRSGTPTIATSGADFVQGKRWGRLRGSLAVAALAGERLVFLTFDRRGRLQRTASPAALTRLGRLRTVHQLANGDLAVLTDADGAQGAVYRVRPAR